MLVGYLIGTSVVALVIACCGLARGGDGRAEVASMIAAGAFAGLGWVGLVWALVLMLIAPQLHEEGSISWWSLGVGQQLIVACGGAFVLTGAARAVSRERYVLGAGLIVLGACLFALWGLLIDGSWSARGPFAG